MTGAQFREWRTARGWSQADTGRVFQYTKQAIQLIESKPDVSIKGVLVMLVEAINGGFVPSHAQEKFQ